MVVRASHSGSVSRGVGQEPGAARAFVDRARDQAASGRTFVLVNTEVAGVPYQAVVQLLYRSDEQRTLFGLVGFTVDMEWVRQNYFQPIVRQVARIGGEADEMALEIVNEEGRSSPVMACAGAATWFASGGFR